MAQKFLGKKAVAQAKKHAPPSRHAHQISKQRKGRVVFKNNKESKAAAGERTVRLCAARAVWLAIEHAPQEITRLINERNEVEFARKATQSGGSLTVVRPPPEAKGSKKQSLKTNLKSAVGGRQ